MRANIVSWDSGGLSADIDILWNALLEAGCEVHFKGRRERRPRNRLHSLLSTARAVLVQSWSRISRRPRYDLTFFVETVFPEYLPASRHNLLLVNPEWFRPANSENIASLDLLLCKSQSGVRAVSDLGVATRNIAFTSPDRLLTSRRREPQVKCLHVAGQSALKGTDAVVAAWERHPEWPHLTVVRRAQRYGGESAPALRPLPNVAYETGYVSPAQMQLLQNECAVHVCPSVAEGYGHVIGEAMSCGALVVTTDAPPMNELIDSDRGVLVRVAHSEPKDRSTLSYVDVDDLEQKLAMVFAMPADRFQQMQKCARRWFEDQDARFRRALLDLVAEFRTRP